MPSPVIDVHTHMLTPRWLEMLAEHGGEHLAFKINPATGKKCIFKDGAPFMTPTPPMSDYDLRIRKMNEAKVDVAIVSLTCPNVFFGTGEISLAAAKDNNDSMAAAKTQYPDRIRWFASLPWQFPELAVAELDRALAQGASGVVVLGNIAGKPLTDPQFAPVWRAIDDKSLPVFIHPTAPPGIGEMGMNQFNLTPPLGFTFDTSLAVARLILDGFLDRHPNLKIIAGHGGGTIPYLAGRMDFCWDNHPGAREKTKQRPTEYLKRVYADAVLFRQDALEMCVSVFGQDNVMYGSDYPHAIGDMVGCLGRVDSLSAAQRDKVRGRNAERIFAL
jgi:aminocarboxymuconate-semialdehyde decarboxylase